MCKLMNRKHLALGLVPIALLASALLAGGENLRRQLGPESASVTLNAYDDEINKLLEDALEAEATGDYEQAVRLLQDATVKATDQVYRVSHRTYLGVREYVRSRIRHWPPEGLATYRRIVDPRAEELYRTAARKGDPRILGTVARQFALSSSGPRARLDLGTRALARGDLDRALYYYLGILDLHPDGDIPGVSRAEVLARAALAAAKRGDRYLLEEMRSRARATAPGATVDIGGAKTPLAGFLQGLSPAPHGSYAPAGWTTAGGSASRTGGRGGPKEPLALYWTWRIPRSHPVRATDRQPSHSPVLPVHPLIADGQIIVVGHGSIHALRLPEPAEPGAVLPEPSPETIWQHPTWIAKGIANSKRGQRPAHSTAAEGVLAAPFRDADEFIDESFQDDEDPRKETLVVLSLGEEGKLRAVSNAAGTRLDQRGGTDPLLEDRYRGVEFSGAPVVLDRRVYIAGTRSKRLVETLVFCFEQRGYPDALRPLWTTSVCLGAGRKEDLVSDDEEMPASSIAVKNGVLYLCSNTGAVAALDAETGDIAWVYTYETDSARLGLYTREKVSLTTWFQNPVMLDHRYVYAAPVDSRYLQILFQHFQGPRDARTFDVAHDKFNALTDVVYGFEPEYLLGAQDGVVFIAGSSRGGERPLFAVKSGPAYLGSADMPGDQARVLWRAAIEEDAPYGRGVLAGDAIFFPTEKGIYRVETADGRVTKLVEPGSIPQIKLMEKDRGDFRVVGNLAVAGPWLVSASERTVSLFGPPPPEKVTPKRDD